jgi:NADH-quinone oxidoreductase subunit E
MFSLSPEGLEKVKKELTRYETKQSAIIPSLYIAQSENKGWINEEVISHLSQVMEIPEVQIQEVFQFYTMFNQKPVGQYHVQICGTLSCHVNGAPDLMEFLCKSFDVAPGEVSPDGRYTISRVECLGSCGTAPMMQVNDRYYENLTPESALTLLKGLP